jgi:RNA polymerase sigma factor (sigma-70 family)
MTTASREADWTMWMRAALAGDSGSYRKFLHSVAPYIRAVARSRCRRLGVQESEAEDIVQEVLLTIHLKQATWDRSREIGPWVGAITRNKIIDALRRRGRRIDVPIDDFLNALPAEEQSPELAPGDIDVLIGKLPSQQQEIVRSISLNGVSIRDTAERLKMTEGAVRVSLHRSLKALGALYRSSVYED